MAEQTSNITDHYAYINYDIKKVIREFKKPLHYNCFFTNRDYLLENSELINFNNPTWDLRPDVFCSDYYNEPYLFPVIVLINGLKSQFEFTSKNLRKNIVLAPSKNSIYEVLSYRI